MKRKRKNGKNTDTELTENINSISEKKPINKKKIWIIAASVAGVLIITTGIVLAALNPGSNIAKGVKAGGINIGGKTIEEAKTLLSQSDTLKNREFVLKDTVSGKQTTISASSISFGYDIDKMVNEAYKIGRGKGLISDAASLLKLQFSSIDVPDSYTYDEAALQKALYDFGVSVNGEQKNYQLEFGDGVVTVKRGESGQSKDVSDLQEAFLTAVKNGENEVSLTLEIKNPPDPDVESIYNEIYSAPQAATYTITDGKMKVTPGKPGISIDKTEVAGGIDAIKNGGSATFKIVTVAPTVTEETINAELFGTVLGKFATSYSTSSQNRSDNVELAASKIDGTVLMPGEEFSYNKTVGERTSANGFKSAPVFDNGETVQGMGGGVCQVSSTLYSAVLYADLPVLERQSHSLVVSYVPKGQDATVAYGSIDFKFKNDTKGPIKISAKTAGKRIEITIWGAKPEKEKKVEIVNSVTSTISPTVQETEDSSLPAGSTKIVSSGKTGYVVSTVRKVYENGTLVKSENMPTSRYKMVPTKVLVGKAATEVFNENGDGENTDSDSDRPNSGSDKPDSGSDKPDSDKPSDTGSKPEGSGAQRPSANEDETE